MSHRKIAIVYDWLDKWGGVERVLLHLHELFPDATFFTSYFDKQTAPWAGGFKVQTSFLQEMPNFVKKSRILSLPLYPYAFESFDFSGYESVISVTSSFAKGILVKPGTKHICYLLTPTRFLWVHPDQYIKNSFQKKLFSPFVNYLRKWDYLAAQRPDSIVSISKTVADRCKKYYRRSSEVIYPPFDEEYWHGLKIEESIEQSDFYLVVSRLEPYKNVELAIEVFSKMPDKKLIIAGTGSQLDRLKSQATENVQFIGTVSDSQLSGLYSSARALIMPQEEDFGYVALEAQIFGCPVIAYRKGGVLETVVEGKTGVFFDKQTASSLSQALALFHTLSYNNKIVARTEGKKQALLFSKKFFENKFRTLISS